MRGGGVYNHVFKILNFLLGGALILLPFRPHLPARVKFFGNTILLKIYLLFWVFIYKQLWKKLRSIRPYYRDKILFPCRAFILLAFRPISPMSKIFRSLDFSEIFFFKFAFSFQSSYQKIGGV